jgi:DNA repair exonuclease SbcCD ATPase subunit
MKISYVELAGFRGFKEKVRFEFPKGFAVLTGRNGVGKSTVLDAIDFVLSGTIAKYEVKEAKGGGLQSHIWWVGEGVPDREYVSVGFVDEAGAIFEVVRSRQRGLQINPEAIQAKLCVPGFPVEEWARTLMQTTLFRDETIAALSLDLPQQARFEAVRAAIGGLRGRDYTPRTSAVLAAAENATVEQEKRVLLGEQQLSRALSALTEARSIVERESDVAAAEKIVESLAPEVPLSSTNRSESLRRIIAERKGSITSLRDALAQVERLLAEKSYFESEVGHKEFEAAQDAVSETERGVHQAKAQLTESDQVLKNRRGDDTFATQMIALLDHGETVGLQSGHCPLCAAVRSPEEFAAAIAAARDRLKDQLSQVASAEAELREAQSSLQQASVELEKAQHRLAGLEKRRRAIVQGEGELARVYAMAGITAAPTDVDGAQALILKRLEDNATLEHALFTLEISGAHDRAAGMEMRVNHARSNREKEISKLEAARRAEELARQINVNATLVGNDVLAEQFDIVMPLLKELYSRLRPHTDWREIETDFGGRVRASLNFTVGGKNPQFFFSSGQRRAAGLAFLLAIHLSRPWSALDSLLLDDPVQHIDDYRALNLVEVLAAIRRTGRQLIVAVEDPALADVLCRRLRSTTEEPGRRFELGTTKSGSAIIERQNDISPLPDTMMAIAEAS